MVVRSSSSRLGLVMAVLVCSVVADNTVCVAVVVADREVASNAMVVGSQGVNYVV